MQLLLQTPGLVGDLLLVLGQVAGLSLAFWLVWRLVRLGLLRVTAGADAGARLLKVMRLLFVVLFGLAILAVLIADAVLFMRSGDLTGATARIYRELPPGFVEQASMMLAQWVTLALAAALIVWLARKLLGSVHARAKGWERLTANDAAVDAFFGFLATAVAASVWLLAAALALSLAPATQNASAVAFTLLRLFLIVAVALLLVRATAAVVASLDALSTRFAGPSSPLRAYNELRGLVPLLRRCLEAAIWLAAASLMLLQVQPVATLAEGGPRLILVVAIFFLARVAAELTTLLIGRIGSEGAELTELERQQRATLVPLLASLGRTAVYFLAFVLVLTVLGFNPLPILAGAGILGVVVGLGAQPVINDLVSGFFVLSESQFLVGDYIEVGSSRGVVEAISLRTTTIRDPDGPLHILRNGQLPGVVNYSKRYAFAVVEVELPHGSDLDAAMLALQAAGDRLKSEHADVLEPTEVEGIDKLDAEQLTMRTKTKVRPGAHGPVARAYRRLVLDELRRAQVEPYGAAIQPRPVAS